MQRAVALAHQRQLAVLQAQIGLGFTQLAVDVGSGAQQFDAQIRVVGKALVDARTGAVQQGLGGCLTIRFGSGQARVGTTENTQQEVLHRLCTSRLGAGFVGLPGHAQHTGQQGEGKRRSHGHHQSVAPNQLGGAVPQRDAPRRNRQVLAVAQQIIGQVGHRGITIIRRDLQGLVDDGVEVTAQGAAARRVLHMAGRQRRVDGRGRARLCGHGGRAGEQLEQHQAQGVHIGGHAHRRPRQLLGCGVARRGQHALGAGQRGAAGQRLAVLTVQ